MVESIIKKLIELNGYLNNEHVLGILFYGSYLTGFYNQNSDIDLLIIFDNNCNKSIIRGNCYIEGIRVEYFEKPMDDVYSTINEDFLLQNNASLSIIGKSKIVFKRNESIEKLQNYTIEKFKHGIPKLSNSGAMEQISIINNRMEKLKKYAEEDNPFFKHLWNLTIDKIRRFYHSLNGCPRIETYKGFKLYTNIKYQSSFYIDSIPDELFRKMYFNIIKLNITNKIEAFELLEQFYNYTKRNIIFNEEEYRIPIISRNKNSIYSVDNNLDVTEIKKSNIPIPSEVLIKVLKFMKEMRYLEDEHFLGIIVYGSSLTGYNTDISDIDLQVIFDNSRINNLIRGAKVINRTKIEYFEKPIYDVYLSIENDFANQNNASFSIIGNGSIVFEKNNEISNLQKYALARFNKGLSPLDEESAKEQVSIINNKIEKLENLVNEDSPYFNHYYHLVIDKIRKFYHKLIGISKIQTSKVYRIYTDKGYRESMYKENPDQYFVDSYLNLINFEGNKYEKLKLIKEFYSYAKRNIKLENDYRILLKRKNRN